jgi:anti-sigma regulatory factor (Ser/Thr protein kinase)
VESLLTDRWLADLDTIPIHDEASISLVRDWVRREGAAAGLSEVETGALVNVASELAHNQLGHAAGGRVAVRQLEGRKGVEVIAADAGQGIADPRAALRGAGRTEGKSLGIGLSAVCELADEVDIDVRLREGTCVRARKLAAPFARERCVGIFGRPIEGERVSGDDATFLRVGGELLVALCDGLGHGPEAREASSRAVAVIALVRTRGAVMSAASIDKAGTIDVALLGNVEAYVCGRSSTRRHVGNAAVLGKHPTKGPLVAHDTLASAELLVLFSDGLSTRLSLEREDALLHEHPIVIAQALMTRYGTTRDDATVVVVC